MLDKGVLEEIRPKLRISPTVPQTCSTKAKTLGAKSEPFLHQPPTADPRSDPSPLLPQSVSVQPAPPRRPKGLAPASCVSGRRRRYKPCQTLSETPGEL